jgi:pimeloyl-ACP methyl ester carboxylesterase
MFSLSPRRFHSLLVLPALLSVFLHATTKPANNHPPTAVDANYTVHGILYGSFPFSDPFYLVSNGSVSHGDLRTFGRFNGYSQDSFIYEPNYGYIGADSFTYHACDSSNNCVDGTINVNVVNSAPNAVAHSYDVQGGTLFVGSPSLLEGDSDPDGDPFSVVSYTQASHGTVNYFYQYDILRYDVLDPSYVGTDSFTYRVCDYLGLCAEATVTLNVNGEPTPTPTPTPSPTPDATPSSTPPPPPPPSPTPTPTPTEPLIFIPGIAGSYLVDKTNGAELWPGVGTNHDRLSLNPGDSPNPNVVATDVIRRVLSKNFYGPLIEMLTSRGGYREYQVNSATARRTSAGCDLGQKSNDPNLNPSLFVFAYDWRQSNVENALKLKDYTACIQQFYPDSKVNIIAHSMGSLVARRYILDNPGKVKKLITIAGAWLGAPKSVYTLETGDADFSRLLVWHSTLRRLSKFFKSIQELIPSESYFDIGERPFAEQGDFNRNGVPDETYSYSQEIALLNQRYPQSMPGSVNLAFHSYPGQDDWRSDNTGVEYHHILGVQHINQTIGRVIAQRVNVCFPIRDELNCFDREVFTAKMTNGDGTVPERSATRIGANNLNALGAQLWYNFSLDDDHDELVEHTALTQLQRVHDRVLFILGKGPDPGTGDIVAKLPPSNRNRIFGQKDFTFGPSQIAVSEKNSMSSHMSKTVRTHHASLIRRSMSTRESSTGTTVPPYTQGPSDPQKAPAYYLTITGVDFVSVTDDQGNSNTPIDDTFALRVPNVTYNLIGEKTVLVSMPTDKTYTIKFRVGSEPVSVEVLKGLDNNTPTQAVRYRDAVIPAGATAMLKLTSEGIETLRYDVEGDGIFEASVTPTASLSGAAAADVMPPAISISGEPQQTKVSVTINTQDGGSGVKATYYSFDRTHYRSYTGPFFVDPAQVSIVYAFADDNAANRSAMTTYDVPRLPGVTAPPNLSLTTGANETSCGITISEVMLGNATAISNSSGTVTITRTGVPAGNFFPVGTTSVTYTATDSDGLITTATQTVTIIDGTPPALTCPTNVMIFLPTNSSATSMMLNFAAPTANDNCSGTTVTTTPVSGSVFPVGTTLVTTTATDAAGNSGTCSITVSVLYKFAGFFAPVNSLPVLNAVNAGRAIPLKFSLSGNKGLSIFAAPNNPGSGVISCDSTTAEIELDQTLAAGNSSLSYDSSSDQYTYVWKTDSAWAGTCRQLILQLSDGTLHRANFKFK